MKFISQRGYWKILSVSEWSSYHGMMRDVTFNESEIRTE